MRYFNLVYMPIMLHLTLCVIIFVCSEYAFFMTLFRMINCCMELLIVVHDIQLRISQFVVLTYWKVVMNSCLIFLHF